MEIEFDPDLVKQLNYLKKRQPNLYRKIQKQIKLFQTDPTYPSLRNHKLEGKLKNSYSITIEGNFRLVYLLEGNTAYFYLSGNHDEVYKFEI